MSTYHIVIEIATDVLQRSKGSILDMRQWENLRGAPEGYYWYRSKKTFDIRIESDRIAEEYQSKFKDLIGRYSLEMPWIGSCESGKEIEFMTPLPEYKLPQRINKPTEYIAIKNHIELLVSRSWIVQAEELIKELLQRVMSHQYQISNREFQIANLLYQQGVCGLYNNPNNAELLFRKAMEIVNSLEWDELVRESKIEILLGLMEALDMQSKYEEARKIGSIAEKLHTKGRW